IMSGPSLPQTGPRTWVPGRPSSLITRIRNAIRLLTGPNHSGEVTITFDLDFDLVQFLESHKKGRTTNLDWAYTLTGYGINVQAASTLEYMTQTWPNTGPILYRYLDWRLRAGILAPDDMDDHIVNGFPHGISFAGSGGLSIFASPRPKYTDLGAEHWQLVARVTGEPDTVAEMGGQFAWFCGAFLKSPKNELVYCKPIILETVFFEAEVSYPGQSRREGKLHIGYVPDVPFDRHDPNVPKTCWNGLFVDQPHTRIVSGYPIRVRPGYAFGNKGTPASGLEVTWRIIMRIREDETPVSRPEDLSSTPIVIRGQWFFLISKVLNRGLVFWHLMLRYTPSGREADLRNLPPPEVRSDFDFEELENYRHFIGGECGERRLFSVGEWVEAPSCSA
ncbi:hypothetical protein B0T21DRAFT_282715, partial [Apiosordaria backusii]